MILHIVQCTCMHYSMLYCLVLFTRRECVYIWISGHCMFTVPGKKGCWPCLIRWCMASSPAPQGSAQLAFSRDRTSSEKKKKKIDIFSHKLQLQSQAGRHKSNVYFKGGKKNSSGFPPMSLWALGLSVTRFIDSIEYCNRNIQFFHSSDDVRGAASWSQRRMTKTMECGSFDRKSLFAEVLRQHCSRRSQVLMSPSDCWVKHLWEITAD